MTVTLHPLPTAVAATSSPISPAQMITTRASLHNSRERASQSTAERRVTTPPSWAASRVRASDPVSGSVAASRREPTFRCLAPQCVGHGRSCGILEVLGRYDHQSKPLGAALPIMMTNTIPSVCSSPALRSLSRLVSARSYI